MQLSVVESLKEKIKMNAEDYRNSIPSQIVVITLISLFFIVSAAIERSSILECCFIEMIDMIILIFLVKKYQTTGVTEVTA